MRGTGTFRMLTLTQYTEWHSSSVLGTRLQRRFVSSVNCITLECISSPQRVMEANGAVTPARHLQVLIRLKEELTTPRKGHDN